MGEIVWGTKLISPARSARPQACRVDTRVDVRVPTAANEVTSYPVDSQNFLVYPHAYPGQILNRHA